MTFTITGILPLISATLSLCAFIAGYGIAVGNDHVDPWLPYISDCGALFPEKNIFGTLLNLSACFLGVTIYFIHRKYMTFYVENNVDIGKWKGFSKFTVLIGWIAALGGILVANFPESEQLLVHTIGAFMFFIGIIVYYWALLIISYSLRPKIVPIHLTNFRLLLTFSLTLILIFHMVTLFAQPFVVKQANGSYPPRPDWPHNIERPTPDSPFFTNHIAATCSEWVLALLILLGILTYNYEFAYSTYHAPHLSQPIKDNTSADTPVINQKETRLNHYDAFVPYSQYTLQDHYSETASTARRLPRVDQIYTAGTFSTRYDRNSPPYNGYTHY